MTQRSRNSEQGVTLIEVLVTVLVLLVGLLGTVGLLGRATAAQVESYQRAQALVLLKDIADRLNANRKNALTYVTAAALGTGDAQPSDCAGLVGQPLDFCEWSNALKGASVTEGGVQLGAMAGARGCIYNTVAAEPREFRVAVAWQGLTRTAAPSVDCGQGAYGADDALRRVVTLSITIAKLD